MILVSLALVLTVLAGCWSRAPDKAELMRRARATAFVQDLYAWYHPSADSSRTIDDVLRQRPAVFAPELRDLLLSDRRCVSGTGEVCRLDFDPILNSQDPCGQYTTGQVFGTFGVVVVGVFPVCGGVRDTAPAVRVMVVERDSTWEILDLYYPERTGSLKDILNSSERQ